MNLYITGDSDRRIEGISFDAYGTLLKLESPYINLQQILSTYGSFVPLESVQKAFRREMDYYRENHLQADSMQGLHTLRCICADILFDALADEGCPLDMTAELRLEILQKAIRFHVFEDTIPALSICRQHDLKIAVTSNWDWDLPNVLQQYGISSYLNTITVSAREGIVKPDPQMYLRSAKRLGIEPENMIHIGDEPEADVSAPAGIGMHGVLIDREAIYTESAYTRISTLTDIFSTDNDPKGSP